MARTFTLQFFPASFVPGRGAVSPAAFKAHSTTGTTRPSWAFDDTDSEYASTSLVMPDEFASGDLKARFYFSAVSTSGVVSWGLSIEAVTSNADTLDLTSADSFDTASTGTTDLAGSTAGDLLRQEVTVANVDSCAKGDLCRLGIFRSHVADTASSDVYLYAVEFFQESS